MEFEAILDYVSKTPANSNRAVLRTMLEELGGGDITLKTLNITENGTYNAESGEAYNKVIANVVSPTPSANIFYLFDNTNNYSEAGPGPLPDIEKSELPSEIASECAVINSNSQISQSDYDKLSEAIRNNRPIIVYVGEQGDEQEGGRPVYSMVAIPVKVETELSIENEAHIRYSRVYENIISASGGTIVYEETYYRGGLAWYNGWQEVQCFIV